MSYYRVDIQNKQIQDCFKIRKSENYYDYLLIKAHGSFGHIDPETKEITPFLLKASCPSEAKAKVMEKLKRATIIS